MPDPEVPGSSPRPVITGTSLITPLGDSVERTWSALLAREAIATHALVPGLPPEGRFGVLADRVAHAALEDAGLRDGLGPESALVFGTSKGPITDWLASGSKCRFPGSFGLSAPAVALARRLNLEGPCVTLSAACSSGLHALIYAAMLIQSRRVRRALVVAVESSIHPLFLGSFQRLGVLARPGEPCRPFDHHRTGFLMSEAGAAVVLEADESLPVKATVGDTCATLPARRLCGVEQFAFGADATHLTGGDAQAKALGCLIRRVIDGRPVDLVHAHATGTLANDELELATIESNLAASERPPSLYSHKGALGHSLGAAGLVSVVLNCQSHRYGIVPPNVMTTSPLQTHRSSLDTGQCVRPIRRSISIAAGFGGALAVFSLVDRGGA